jgi:hypothetical protein
MWKSVWASLFIAAIVYGGGHPSLDGYRPPMLDKPLQAFHQQVNKAAVEGQRVLVGFNVARASYVKAYLGQAERQLHGAQ